MPNLPPGGIFFVQAGRRSRGAARLWLRVVGPNVRAPSAARLTNEQRLKIRQTDREIVPPSWRCHRFVTR
jgi:hypothetical protein